MYTASHPQVISLDMGSTDCPFFNKAFLPYSLWIYKVEYLNWLEPLLINVIHQSPFWSHARSLLHPQASSACPSQRYSGSVSGHGKNYGLEICLFTSPRHCYIQEIWRVTTLGPSLSGTKLFLWVCFVEIFSAGMWTRSSVLWLSFLYIMGENLVRNVYFD